MKKTKQAFASLVIAGMALTMVPFNAFANDTISTRLAGLTAEQTAVAISDQTGYKGTAVLASSTSYGMVDALTAGPLAASLEAPILLTGAGNKLNADTKDQLIELEVETVYVTSGTAVIKQGVIDELEAMEIEVIALGGFDRAETSVNIAKKMTGVTKVAVANGVLDALSIASVASAANQPILLTNKDTLPKSVADYLESIDIAATDVIGGTGVISDAVVAKLPEATRHFGMNAYDTNNQVIQDFAADLEFDNVYVANGVTAIDALAGAPLAAQTKSAIVLTDGKSVPEVAEFTHSKSTASSVVVALGGTAVVPEDVRLGVAAGSAEAAEEAAKVAAAAVAIQELFVDANAPNDEKQLAEGVDQAQIDAATELVNELADGNAKVFGLAAIAMAQDLLDAQLAVEEEAAKVAAAAVAIQGLFVDVNAPNDEKQLAEGVDQAQIDAATALVNELADGNAKIFGLAAIAMAQDLLEALAAE